MVTVNAILCCTKSTCSSTINKTISELAFKTMTHIICWAINAFVWSAVSTLLRWLNYTIIINAFWTSIWLIASLAVLRTIWWTEPHWTHEIIIFALCAVPIERLAALRTLLRTITTYCSNKSASKFTGRTSVGIWWIWISVFTGLTAVWILAVCNVWTIKGGGIRDEDEDEDSNLHLCKLLMLVYINLCKNWIIKNLHFFIRF